MGCQQEVFRLWYMQTVIADTGKEKMKKTYIIEGTFSASIEAESAEQAETYFDAIDIDDYRITSVEEEEE